MKNKTMNKLGFLLLVVMILSLLPLSSLSASAPDAGIGEDFYDPGSEFPEIMEVPDLIQADFAADNVFTIIGNNPVADASGVVIYTVTLTPPPIKTSTYYGMFAFWVYIHYDTSKLTLLPYSSISDWGATAGYDTVAGFVNYSGGDPNGGITPVTLRARFQVNKENFRVGDKPFTLEVRSLTEIINDRYAYQQVPVDRRDIQFNGNISFPTTYTVTFNSQGGSAVPSQTVPAGGKILKPENPTRSGGYSFIDWYKDAACTDPNLYDFNSLVNSSFTLYAKWSSGPVNAMPPVITTHPASATIIMGASHTLNVVANSPDGGTLSYQWYSNTTASNSGGTPISGATGASYNPPTAATGTYYYYVVVTNTIPNNGDGGTKTATATSNAATLTVNLRVNAQPPIITTHPANATIFTGASHTLNVAASSPDGGTLSYQWYSNTTASNSGGTPISGATGASYSPPTATAGTYYYYVVVTNTITDNGDGGTKTATAVSNAATLTVNARVNAQPPIITAHPASATVITGVSHTLNVAANSPDGGTLSYQWYSNTTASNSGGTPISGATNAAYNPPTGTAGTYYYYVVVTNTIADNGDGGTKTATAASNVATLTVNARVNAQAPVITTHPASATVSLGAAHTLNVVASSPDGGTLSYQWYSNTTASNSGGTPVGGATGASYSPPTGTAGTYYYYVVVTNTITDNGDGGTKTATAASNAATLTVNARVNAQPPLITTHPASATVIAGISHTLNVVASSPDGGTLSYQWYSNTTASNSGGTPVSGATGASYNPPTGTAGTYYYYVVVTNTITDNGDGGTKTATAASNAATLTVNARVNAQAPVITTHPASATVIFGATHTLNVVASSPDGGTLSYQWYSNTTASNSGGTPISGATGVSYNPPTGTAGTYYYYVVVTNTIADNGDGGAKTATVASNVATFTVNARVNALLPLIVTHPAGATIVVDASHTMSVVATSSDGGTLSYQWYSNTTASNSGGTPISGATLAVFNPPTGTAGTYYYYVVVTNTIPDNGDGGNKTATATSNAATLTVNARVNAQAPVISTHPASATVIFGATHTLNVAASSPDGGTLSYQWYSNTTASNSGGTPISGATGAGYNPPTGTAGTYYYYVVVTNTIPNNGDGGTKTATATSNAATFTVNARVNALLPLIVTHPANATVAVGASHTLNVVATTSDGGSLSYQWYRNTTATNSGGTPITGATLASFNPTTGTAGTYYYYVVVTNTIPDNGDGGTKTAAAASNAATLTVKDPADEPLIIVGGNTVYTGWPVPATVINIPVKISCTGSILEALSSGYSFTISYDTSMLEFMGPVIDSVNMLFINQHPTDPPGTLRVACASMFALDLLKGLEVLVPFKVIGSPAFNDTTILKQNNATVIKEDPFDGNYLRVETRDVIVTFSSGLLMGDVNNDGVVTIDDAILLMQMIAGVTPFTPWALLVSDMNSDGEIDLADVALILRLIAG